MCDPSHRCRMLHGGVPVPGGRAVLDSSLGEGQVFHSLNHCALRGEV